MMLIRIKKLTVFSLTNTSPAVSNKADSQEILQKFSLSRFSSLPDIEGIFFQSRLKVGD